MKYFVYDSENKEFTSTVEADTPPANSTTISPFGDKGYAPIGTYFDEAAQVWRSPNVGYDDSNPMVSDSNFPGEGELLKQYAKKVDQEDGIKILLLTDTHYQVGTQDKGTHDVFPSRNYVDAPLRVPSMIQNLSVLDGIVNAVVEDGDLTHGHSLAATAEEQRAVLKADYVRVTTMVRNAFTDTKDVFISLGNHETGGVFNKNLTHKLNNDDLLTASEFSANSFGETRSRFCAYKDYANSDTKIRLISLCGFDNPTVDAGDGTAKYPEGSYSVYKQSDLDFLKDALLSTPTGYDVIVFTHAPVMTSNVNDDLVVGMLNAFKNHTSYTGTGSNSDVPATVSVDFSGKENALIATVTGHIHRDRVELSKDGEYPLRISRTCFLPSDRGDSSSESTYTPDSDLGTSMMYAFDTLVINQAAKTVKFCRFGNGKSLLYSYADHTASEFNY